jgi:hypothetical protein
MRRKERGQALIFVVLGVGIVILGAMGLAIDAGQLYGQRQMAQAAADSAAQAAILSIFSGTATSTTLPTSAAFDCTNGTDAKTPCSYARMNNFGTTGSTDTVHVSFPTSIAGKGNLSTDFTPAAVQVDVSHSVSTTFMSLFGATSTTIKASATAAILTGNSPVSIAVLHPTLSNSFQLGDASTSVTITGGPQQALQINSNATSAFSANASATLDLSAAGPTSTGADFGSFGGPSSAGSWLKLGSTGHFYQPSAPTQDPFRAVPVPSVPTSANPGSIDITSANTQGGTGDCPVAAEKGKSGPAPGDCTIYSPGYYPFTTGSGKSAKTFDLSSMSGYAIFQPGVYWVASGGFQSSGGNADLRMCSTTCSSLPAWDTTSCCSTATPSMLVYLASGTVNIGSNGNVALRGSLTSSNYKGILFYGKRDVGTSQSHSLGGGGALTLTGSIYLTSCRTTPCSSTPNISTIYQNVTFSGHSGSTTMLTGEIITDELIMKGGSGITMNLDPGSSFTVSYDYIGLVK